MLDDVWNRVGGGYQWLKSLALGEFQENRPLSVVVTDMMLSFVPGVVVVTSARDLAAVCLRLGQRYRGEASPDDAASPAWQEWALLIACAIGVFGPVICAAVGSAATLAGTAVGFLVGDEAAAFLRALCLVLIREADGELKSVVSFLGTFVKGDVLTLLRQVRFAACEQPLVDKLTAFLRGMRNLLARLRGELAALPSFDRVKTLLTRLDEMEQQFYAVQTRCAQEIPHALAQLDAALQRLLKQDLPVVWHPAYAGVRAVKPEVAATGKLRISSGVGEPPHVLMQAAQGDGQGAGVAAPGGDGSAAALPSSPLDQPVGANVHRDWEDVDPRALSRSRKGIYGELVSDDFMEERGYAAMMSPHRRVRSLEDQPIGRGIDGVYAVPPALQPPEYVITETKYRTGGSYGSRQLPKLKDGTRQMDDEWVGGRLRYAVGKENAAKIEESRHVEKWLMVVSESGKVVDITKLDADANALLDVTGKPVKVPVD